MVEFTVGEHQYRSGKLNAFAQFHVARKIAPLIAKLGESNIKPETDFANMLAPIVDALAAMPEDDCNYVLQRCLGVVQRFQNGVWAPVWNDPAKRLQFEDIDLQVMIQVTLQVLGDNLGNFLLTRDSASPPAPSQGSDTQENLSAFPMVKTG